MKKLEDIRSQIVKAVGLSLFQRTFEPFRSDEYICGVLDALLSVGAITGNEANEIWRQYEEDK